MKFCAFCGRQLEDKDKFCLMCGEPCIEYIDDLPMPQIKEEQKEEIIVAPSIEEIPQEEIKEEQFEETPVEEELVEESQEPVIEETSSEEVQIEEPIQDITEEIYQEEADEEIEHLPEETKEEEIIQEEQVEESEPEVVVEEVEEIEETSEPVEEEPLVTEPEEVISEPFVEDNNSQTIEENYTYNVEEEYEAALAKVNEAEAKKKEPFFIPIIVLLLAALSAVTYMLFRDIIGIPLLIGAASLDLILFVLVFVFIGNKKIGKITKWSAVISILISIGLALLIVVTLFGEMPGGN